MDKFRMAALGMFVAGLALFIAGIMTGDTEVYLAVIIPIVKTSNILSIAGLLLMFGAFFLWVMGIFTHPARRDARTITPKTKPKAGGVVLIGPIPIVFSNDKNLAIILLVLAIVVIVLVSLFMLFII